MLKKIILILLLILNNNCSYKPILATKNYDFHKSYFDKKLHAKTKIQPKMQKLQINCITTECCV